MQLPRVAPQLADRLQQRKPAYAMCSLFPIRFFRLRHFNDRLSPPEPPRHSRFRPASATHARPTKLAGEEGFEPPLSVLETDGLPLNLLPFTLRARQWRDRRVYPKHRLPIRRACPKHQPTTVCPPVRASSVGSSP